jgi:tRNA dimethylallyltransferase
MQKPKVIVILGQTATGKSNLAVKIAKKISTRGGPASGWGAEIISADSRQIYRGMDIGTAKPTKKELKAIPHYLINIKNPNEDYSVAEYKKDALNAINKVIASGKIPILVGGTGLYISAVVNNWEIPPIKENKKLRVKLEQKIKKDGLKKVFDELVALDPETAYIVDPKNPRRVIRALEVAILTGKPFSGQRKKGKGLYKILMIGLKLKPEILKNRINKRILEMIKDGLVKEVKNLVKKYDYRCRALDAIGYREIIDYLKKKITLEQAITQMQNNTWHYARRQMTWFKRDKKIKWFPSPSSARAAIPRLLAPRISGQPKQLPPRDNFLFAEKHGRGKSPAR